MKKTLILLLASVALAGCLPQTKPAGGGEPQAEEETQPQGAEGGVETTLPLQAVEESGEEGTVILQEKDGYVTVKVSVADPGAIRPIQISNGTCATPEDLKYPLNDIIQGVSETTLGLPMSEFLGQGPMVLNVYKSPDESTVRTACADLSSP